MKKKSGTPAGYSQPEPTAHELKEAALAYGVRCDVMNVREARDQFSSLLDRAASGEQIIITSDGHPKAMIVQYRPIIDGPKWISLRAFRETMPMGPDSAALLDEIRGDRF